MTHQGTRLTSVPSGGSEGAIGLVTGSNAAENGHLGSRGEARHDPRLVNKSKFQGRLEL